MAEWACDAARFGSDSAKNSLGGTDIMTTKKPVVVYGVTGYTGRLVCEYLRELNVPFIAAGRDKARVQAVLDKVPGIETAEYEVAQVEHTVEALTELFKGATTVSNMVGPFSQFGPEVVEACLAAGCHYTDTTGEQDWVLSTKERWGAHFANMGLLLSPGLAQMYTTGEIAANICLETPGLDSLDILVLWKGLPTYASTQTIFAILQAKWYHLEQNKFVEWPQNTHQNVNVPGQHAPALVTPWAGTSHPVWFKDDPRVANCKAMGGVFAREVMEGFVATQKMFEEQIKPLPPDQQQAALANIAKIPASISRSTRFTPLARSAGRIASSTAIAITSKPVSCRPTPLSPCFSKRQSEPASHRAARLSATVSFSAFCGASDWS
jgi:hypothetical protein